MAVIHFLNANQIEAVNTVLIHRFSPHEQVGVKDIHLLESALNRPKQSVLGDDAYPTIFEKAGALFESIALNHAFFNANKRTALACLILFLKINHYRWTMSLEKEQDFVVDLVNRQFPFSKMVEIIKMFSEPMQKGENE